MGAPLITKDLHPRNRRGSLILGYCGWILFRAYRPQIPAPSGAEIGPRPTLDEGTVHQPRPLRALRRVLRPGPGPWTYRSRSAHCQAAAPKTRQATGRPPPLTHQVLHILPDQRAVTQIVVRLQPASELRSLRGRRRAQFHQGQRSQVGQRAPQRWIARPGPRHRPGLVAPAIGGDLPAGGQNNPPALFQFEQQRPRGHVFELARRRLPLPPSASSRLSRQRLQPGCAASNPWTSARSAAPKRRPWMSSGRSTAREHDRGGGRSPAQNEKTLPGPRTPLGQRRTRAPSLSPLGARFPEPQLVDTRLKCVTSSEKPEMRTLAGWERITPCLALISDANLEQCPCGVRSLVSGFRPPHASAADTMGPTVAAAVRSVGPSSPRCGSPPRPPPRPVPSAPSHNAVAPRRAPGRVPHHPTGRGMLPPLPLHALHRRDHLLPARTETRQ